MTVNGVCHTLWDDVVVHVCGKRAGHDWAHVCACGAVLYTGASSLTPEQRELRARDCPVCHARAGRPCHTKIGAVMTGVHVEREP
jgi:hypothetical protein